MPFNEEKMVRTIFNSKIPIVTAIGHETDITLADFVSDLRSPTPSAAAEMVVPDRKEILIRIKDKFSRMQNDFLKFFDRKNNSLELLNSKLPDFSSILNSYFQNLDLADQKISSNLEKIFLEKKMSYLTITKKLNADFFLNSINIFNERLFMLSKKISKETLNLITKSKLIFSSKANELSIISHRETLKRGFAIVRKDKKIISDDDQIKKKDKIEIEFFKNKTLARKL